MDPFQEIDGFCFTALPLARGRLGQKMEKYFQLQVDLKDIVYWLENYLALMFHVHVYSPKCRFHFIQRNLRQFTLTM